MSTGKRIVVVLTVLWVLSILVSANSGYRFDWNLFFAGGLIPVVVLWGGYWIILGFKSNSKIKVESGNELQIDNSENADSSYEEKLKKYGVQGNPSISIANIALLIVISIAVGSGTALSGSAGKRFDLASSIGFNLPMAVFLSWIYCYSKKAKLKSDFGFKVFFVVYVSLIFSHYILMT